MKKFILAVICAVGAAAMCFYVGCGKKDKLANYVKDMQKSADSVTVVDAEVRLIDKEVTVYTFKRHIEVDLGTHTASVADTKTILSENFENATTSNTVAAENVTGSSLIGLNLTKSDSSGYEIVDGDLTATIPADKIGKVLSKEITATSDMTLKVDFEGGKLVGAEYTYQNASSRTVSVTISYNY